MNKTIIAPIVAVICLTVTALTGVEIDAQTQSDVVTALGILISAGITVWGIIKNHKKKEVK